MSCNCAMRVLFIIITWIGGCLITLQPISGYAQDAKPAQATPADAGANAAPKGVVLFEERFTAEMLDLTRWAHFLNGTFKDIKHDLLGKTGQDRRLRLRAQPTQDEPMLHGIRTVKPVVDLTRPVEITFDFDWNHPKAVSDMLAGIYICPTRANVPAEEENWIGIVYNGFDNTLPNNGYLSVGMVTGETGAVFFDDGWQAFLDGRKPGDDKQFVGRKLGLMRLRVVLSKTEMTVWENEKKICTSKFTEHPDLKKPLDWSAGYLYLVQGLAESTPAPREVYFKNITVRQLE